MRPLSLSSRSSDSPATICDASAGADKLAPTAKARAEPEAKERAEASKRKGLVAIGSGASSTCNVNISIRRPELLNSRGRVWRRARLWSHRRRRAESFVGGDRAARLAGSQRAPAGNTEGAQLDCSRPSRQRVGHFCAAAASESAAQLNKSKGAPPTRLAAGDVRLAAG